jgi:hypothetical protein
MPESVAAGKGTTSTAAGGIQRTGTDIPPRRGSAPLIVQPRIGHQLPGICHRAHIDVGLTSGEGGAGDLRHD